MRITSGPALLRYNSSMNRRTLLLSSLALSLAPDVWAQEPKSAKLALVIGCKNYLFGKPLGNTLNDARDMKAALEALGYDVLYLEDPSLKKLTEQLAEFAKKAKAASERVVYYSGHGVQVNGVNYLLPVTFQAKEMADLPDQALGLAQLMGALPESGVNIVILDACRDNPFSKSFRSTGGSNVLSGLGNQERPTGTLIAYATKPGDVASDASPNGRNGLYTGELLKHLKTPGLTVEQVFKRTRAGVITASNKQQQPWDESSLTSEFAFTPGISAVASPDPKPESKSGTLSKGARRIRKGGMEMAFVPGNGITASFWMDITPVTVKQYKIYCTETGRSMPEPPRWGWIDSHPIVKVSWYEAVEYAGWAGCRLPVATEFAYAASDGGRSIEYPWGDRFDIRKLWCSLSRSGDAGRTAPVKRSDRIFTNSHGLSDMAGNVWQWCGDVVSRNTRYAQGASWWDEEGGDFSGFFRCVARGANIPNTKNDNLGFRICLSE